VSVTFVFCFLGPAVVC